MSFTLPGKWGYPIYLWHFVKEYGNYKHKVSSEHTKVQVLVYLHIQQKIC